MKHRNAFTLIELLVCIAIIAILAGILIDAAVNAKKRQQAKQGQTQQVSPAEKVNVGDTVYIGGLNITGRVNRIHADIGPDWIDILIAGTNGVPTMIENINENLIKKITPLEDWRRH